MRSLVVLLLLGITLTACSGDETDEPDASPAPPAASTSSASGESGGEASGTSELQSDAELASVTADALRVTPPLESYFFGAGHATTLEEAVAALAENELELSPGNQVGGYAYDEADEDFKLCIQGPTGAFATYDTSPMSLFETGASGGCR
jgi:hypothetical protein